MCKKIAEIEMGKTETVAPVLLKKVEEKLTKNKKRYIQMTFTDGVEEIVANLWDRSASEIHCEAGDVVKVLLECSEYNGGKSYVVKGYGPDPSGNPEDFVKKSPGTPEKMFAYIWKQTEDMPEDLKAVTQYLLSENKEKFCLWPASTVVHHAYRSGLLFHTIRVMESVIHDVRTYDLDKSLAVAGAILHDIGKIEEITVDGENYGFSVKGNMFGHAFLGIQMVTAACAALKIEETENIMLLENIIASHHLKLEHGAISKPATKEAMAVHYNDEKDSRMDLFEETLNKMQEDGTCSERIYFADNANAYKRKAVTEEAASEGKGE